MLASRLVLIGQHYTKPQKRNNHLRTACNHYTNHTQPTPPTHKKGGVEHKRVTILAVVIVVGKRPETFRTRKLSPQTPMVLHPTECGRVGHRRNNTIRKAPGGTAPQEPFYFQNNKAVKPPSTKPPWTTIPRGGLPLCTNTKHKTQNTKTVCTLTLNSTYSPTGTCQGAHCCTCPSKKAVLMRLFCNRAFPSVRCVGPCISRIAVIVSSESSLYTAQPSRLP